MISERHSPLIVRRISRSLTAPRRSSNGARSAAYPQGRGGMSGGTSSAWSGELPQFQALLWTIRLRPRADLAPGAAAAFRRCAPIASDIATRCAKRAGDRLMTVLRSTGTRTSTWTRSTLDVKSRTDPTRPLCAPRDYAEERRRLRRSLARRSTKVRLVWQCARSARISQLVPSPWLRSDSPPARPGAGALRSYGTHSSALQVALVEKFDQLRIMQSPARARRPPGLRSATKPAA